MTVVAPYGSWPSPLSASALAAGGIRVGAPAQRGSEVWWSELRPEEGGRVVVVSREGTEGEPVDHLPVPWSARSLVHEYGGGAWWLDAGAVYFSAFEDQRLYRLEGGTDPVALTQEPPAHRSWRFADGRNHPEEPWLVCVRERHGDADEAINELVAVATDGSAEPPRVLGVGPDQEPTSDFVAAPRFSADGRWLSWIRWNHPNMPWDGTELCVAPVFGGVRLGNIQVVAGGREEAVHGANWTADGRLVFSTDRSGFWNLHAWSPGTQGDHALTGLEGAEIGVAQWSFGAQQWAELADGRLVAVVTTEAVDQLAMLDRDGSLRAIETPYVEIDGLAATDRNTILVTASSATATAAVVELDLNGDLLATYRRPDDIGVDASWFSAARSVRYPISGGTTPDREMRAFLYLPSAPDHRGPDDELPPLVVMGHGGPTSHATPALNLRVQYWTSRGFAVADVNYGGSTGFGRDYRRLLNDRWGIVDVEDCITVASRLADDGLVDRNRMAIRGGSAGGYTVLAALTQSQVFAAGTSLYGIADLEALARDTHKFESRYTDGLIGPYPQRRDVYIERSPINHTENLSCPLLVLQGLEDEIVPPNQAEAIVAAIAAKGLPHAYVTFEGEQHGFRQAANIIRSYELELWFYSRVFGFDPADRIEPPEGAVGLD